VTGSSTGIGKETARVLAFMGATVILACCDVDATPAVVEELKKDTQNTKIEFIEMDLADLKSIKRFADEFKRKYDKLNLLINNAGVMAIPKRQETKDGFEYIFGVNYLGHFFLNNLLLDLLRKTAPSRIINLSSSYSKYGKINWDDLMSEKSYIVPNVYSPEETSK